MLNPGQYDARRVRYCKQTLFDEITEVSFVLDELRLYLDTHPDNAEALTAFTEYMKRRHELIAKYSAEFGPIDSYYVDTENGWTWAKGPMPWKCEV